VLVQMGKVKTDNGQSTAEVGGGGCEWADPSQEKNIPLRCELREKSQGCGGRGAYQVLGAVRGVNGVF